MTKYKPGVCPICGKPYTSDERPHWVYCPAVKRQVCMRHCYEECPHINHFNGKCYWRDDKIKEYREQQEKSK